MSAATRAPRAELAALVTHYHHLESEHERAHPGGSVRHHLAVLMQRDRDRFEHLLAAYIPDEALRVEWRAFLHHRAPEPPGPPPIRGLVFKGRSDAGSVVELHRERSGDLAVEVDGGLVERLPAVRAPITEGRGAIFRLDGANFREVFDAPPAALKALDDLQASGGSPPWEHASELLADGLIDVNFGLTARGRRALATRAELSP